LKNYSISVKLCCDILPKNVTLPIINLKCENLKPGKNKIIELLDIFPCFQKTDNSGSGLKNLIKIFGGVEKDRLAFLTEAWYVSYVCIYICMTCVYTHMCTYIYVCMNI
jgi:hypothetical protein